MATAPGIGPFLALLLTMAFFSLKSDRFLQAQNLSLVMQQAMVVGVLAIGQTLIILTAGIDLSCGVVMALGAMVVAKLAVETGLPVPLAMLAGVGVTCLFGLVNGLLVTRARLPAFIVTLGTMNIAFALTQMYSKSQTVSNLPDSLTAIGNTFALGGTQVSWGTLLMLGLYLVAWRLLGDTAPGRHIYAVGNHTEAARLTGIRVERVVLGVYVLAGFFYGIAALLSIARTG